ncbi:type II toxin-antitoxin system ParD family antitoxin [Escherichia coli]|uniref:type II toxin-antitoxin system ParD family antitoxin n=1 Tax=Escherichia coli TaxID=562 RepID=UPI003D65B14F
MTNVPADERNQNETIREALRLLREKLAEGLRSGEAQPWEKDSFLHKVKAGNK